MSSASIDVESARAADGGRGRRGRRRGQGHAPRLLPRGPRLPHDHRLRPLRARAGPGLRRPGHRRGARVDAGRRPRRPFRGAGQRQHHRQHRLKEWHGGDTTQPDAISRSTPSRSRSCGGARSRRWTRRPRRSAHVVLDAGQRVQRLRLRADRCGRPVAGAEHREHPLVHRHAAGHGEAVHQGDRPRQHGARRRAGHQHALDRHRPPERHHRRQADLPPWPHRRLRRLHRARARHRRQGALGRAARGVRGRLPHPRHEVHQRGQARRRPSSSCCAPPCARPTRPRATCGRRSPGSICWSGGSASSWREYGLDDLDAFAGEILGRCERAMRAAIARAARRHLHAHASRPTGSEQPFTYNIAVTVDGRPDRSSTTPAPRPRSIAPSTAR